MKQPGLPLLAAAFCLFCSGPALAHEFVLDPGHSKNRPGAKSCSGAYEYAYNDNLAGFISRHLAARNIAVEMTRTPDGEISLTDRAKTAAGKKLFLSLHHDSAQPQFVRQINGNPCSDKAEGYSIFVSAKNPHFQKSLACARVLGEALRRSGLVPSAHHGENIKGENRKSLDAHLGIYLFDDLVVLKNAESPALLLEAAVIINPADEVRAGSEAYRLKIAQAVEQTMLFAKKL
ncbi:MAG: N-acetylmuramoyl-L-alanine amidase [Desulfovibrio sp.]|jgi:N-acetylmuramoyl-L-alanine amidase|nr:N-acetylmuramoyl-L-alanine amidase [Desulfovibrio sp.]